MRIRARRWLISTVAVVMSVAVTGCGSSASTSSGISSHAGNRSATTPASASGLAVAPRSGNPGTTFRFSFRTPTAAGRHGHFMVSYTLGVLGPQGTGCQAQRSAAVAASVANQHVTLMLAPQPGGGAWCVGHYTARVSEVEGPYCPPGTMCPQFVRVLGVIGRATFSVRSG